MKHLSPKARAALDDLFLFLTEYWGLQLWEDPHRRMCAEIEAAENDKAAPYAMLCVHRGTRKSSIARGAAVWKQLRQIFLFDNPYHRIVFAGATLPLSETSIRTIESGLRYNKKLIEAYGQLWLNDRKKDMSSRHPEGIILAPRLRAGGNPGIAEPSFWAASVRRISTGFHADEAIVDDLNNAENTATDHQRLKVQQYWELLFPIINPSDLGGRPSHITMLATPWHDDDVAGRIRRNEQNLMEQNPNYKSKWHILKEGAYKADGTAFFPQIYDLDVLESLRENMGAREFAANFLCDPVGDHGFVDEPQIVFMPREKMPTPLRWLRAAVDPSQHNQAKELGCYTAIAVGGYDRFANLYVLDARGSREWDTADVIDAFFQLDHDYKDIPIMVEDAHMSHFRHALQMEEAARSERAVKAGEPPQRPRVQWIPVGSESKYQKWEKLQPRFRAHRIYFAEEIDPKLKAEIKEELVRGTAARFKDFLDALAMLENGVSPRMARDGQMIDQSRNLSKMNPDNPQERTWANLMPEWRDLEPASRLPER